MNNTFENILDQTKNLIPQFWDETKKIVYKKITISNETLYFIYEISLISVEKVITSGELNPIGIINKNRNSEYKLWLIDENKDCEELVKDFTLNFLEEEYSP